MMKLNSDLKKMMIINKGLNTYLKNLIKKYTSKKHYVDNVLKQYRADVKKGKRYTSKRLSKHYHGLALKFRANIMLLEDIYNKFFNMSEVNDNE